MSAQQAPRLSVPMKRLDRAAIGGIGLASWVAGSVATFKAGEGSGAAALIGVGALASILALIGHWPSRMVVGGNEIGWDVVDKSVDQQIEVAEDAGDETAVKQLEDLRRQLAEVRRTGALPKHPAAEYDESLHEALKRILPGVPIVAAPGVRRDRADFVLELGRKRLHVETKFKSDPARPFSGSTLAPLLSNVGEFDRLLVVTNAFDVANAEREVQARLRSRGRVVSWLGPKDDAALQAGVESLMKD